MISSKRALALFVAMTVFAGAPAASHDPNELGAGPGPANVSAPQRDGKNAGMQMDRNPATDAHPGDEASMGHMHDGSLVGKTFSQRLFNWLGRLHVMVIHFPIAMIIGAFGIELFGLWRRNARYQHVARIMLVVGTLGAIVAASLGWFAGGFYLADRNPVLMTHRWLGTSIAAFASLLVYLAFARRRRQRKDRAVYWLLLAGLTVAISIQGWLGGSFMHGGLRHLAF